MRVRGTVVGDVRDRRVLAAVQVQDDIPRASDCRRFVEPVISRCLQSFLGKGLGCQTLGEECFVLASLNCFGQLPLPSYLATFSPATHPQDICESPRTYQIIRVGDIYGLAVGVGREGVHPAHLPRSSQGCIKSSH